MAGVPDKRQQSKQRRQARNRAQREALAARREAASQAPAAATSRTRTSGAGDKARSGAAGARGATASAATEPPPKGIMGLWRSRRPGDRAILVALGLAVAAAAYLLFYKVPADDRGEPLPSLFQGLAKAAISRARLSGEPLPDEQISLLDASGPQIFLVLALPIVVALFAVWATRRPDRGRMLTFAMLAMAGSVVLTGGIGIFFFPAMIALAVGGFQARKADLPARVAERATGSPRSGRRRGGVIDVESEEVDTASDADPSPQDADDPAPEDGDDVDPLAELEAELEAERAAEAESGGEDAGGGRRSRRRR